jgi:peroxiredoxin
MNKVVPGFICLCLLLNSCNRAGFFRIRGSFAVADPTPVELFILNEDTRTLVDSTHAKDNDFRLSGPIEQPGIYQLSFFNDQSIYLVLFPGDRIHIDIDNSKSSISYYVENSPESKRVKELVDKQTYVLRQVDQLSKDWELSPADSVQRRKIDSAYMTIMRDQKEFTEEFIRQSPKSLANIMAIYQNFGRKSQPLFDPYDDFNLFRFIDSNLVASYPLSAPVMALNHEVNKIKDQLKHSKYIKKVVDIGRPLPSLKMQDLKGDTLIIDFIMQKPVLVLFWSTWNPYSVKQLELINDFYSTPDAQKFVVVSVALDTDEMKLKDFVTVHNITVPVVCDLKYWDSELIGRYAVRQIPSTLLSNKEGLIVAKDIFDTELSNQLNPSAK